VICQFGAFLDALFGAGALLFDSLYLIRISLCCNECIADAIELLVNTAELILKIGPGGGHQIVVCDDVICCRRGRPTTM
jgi:hypothetical protein